MKTLEKVKKILAERKEDIRKKYGVIILGVFGSIVKGQQKETSDVDILIEIEKPIGFAFFELWDELEKLLGCKVDLVRHSLIREEIKENILHEVVEI